MAAINPDQVIHDAPFGPAGRWEYTFLMEGGQAKLQENKPQMTCIVHSINPKSHNSPSKNHDPILTPAPKKETGS
jgi:hypothetical protein